jgi:HSP20 family protein
MANIAVRKSSTPQPSAAIEWDPFQVMREMMRWDPFREITPLLPDFGARAFSPAFEVKETKEGYIFKADVPGIAEKDLEISMTGNRLTYGSFTRTFTLPEGTDPEHVKAELKEGVLTLQVPKTPEAQPKKIPLKSEKPKA